jgi:hypothetical protein
MDASEQEHTDRKTGSAQAKDRTFAIISAGACIAVAVIAVVVLLLS